MEAFQFELIGASDARVFDAIALGDRARRTIGLLPREAYIDAARKRRLLIVSQSTEVVGYALFGLPRNEVTLTHLVVSESRRRDGLARALVEKISELHPERSGIRAKCRKNYGLAAMWSSLGFYPRGEVEGRGADRATVVVWYRNNPGHVDLFTPDSEPVLRAAMDFNILRDLHDRPHRDGARESLSLVEDHLADKLQLVATPQLYSEVNGIENDARRNKYLAAMSQIYYTAQGDRHKAADLTRELIEAIRVDHPSYPATAQDEEDAKHLGQAAACGVDVFVTRDENLITFGGKPAQTTLGIRVLRPSDLIIRIDELTRADSYRPSDVYGTGYSRHEISSGSEDELAAFQNISERENKRDYLAILRLAATEPERWHRTLVRDPSGRPVLLCLSGRSGGWLEVPLLRVDGRHPASGTLIQHILFELRRSCREDGLRLLKITDRRLSPPVHRAALVDGFAETPTALVALVVDYTGAAMEVQAAAEEAARLAGLRLNFSLRSGMNVFAAAEAERTLWPAKIMDSQLPTFIVPIQPRWSTVLFGVPPTLPLFRTEDWGLGREHVYYRSPKGPRITSPARLLWYKSQGSGRERGESSVIACSLLEEVAVDAPSNLHARFQRLGVWDLSNIFDVSRQGMAQALRFTQTEIFYNPPTGRKLRRKFAEGALSGTVQRPRSISPELFESIYREGTRAGGTA